MSDIGDVTVEWLPADYNFPRGWFSYEIWPSAVFTYDLNKPDVARMYVNLSVITFEVEKVVKDIAERALKAGNIQKQVIAVRFGNYVSPKKDDANYDIDLKDIEAHV